MPGILSVGLRALLLLSRGLGRRVLKSQVGPDAPFQRAKEPVQGFPRRAKEGLKFWEDLLALPSYLLFWAQGTGHRPSGHTMSMGHVTTLAKIIWQRVFELREA